MAKKNPKSNITPAVTKAESAAELASRGQRRGPMPPLPGPSPTTGGLGGLGALAANVNPFRVEPAMAAPVAASSVKPTPATAPKLSAPQLSREETIRQDYDNVANQYANNFESVLKSLADQQIIDPTDSEDFIQRYKGFLRSELEGNISSVKYKGKKAVKFSKALQNVENTIKDYLSPEGQKIVSEQFKVARNGLKQAIAFNSVNDPEYQAQRKSIKFSGPEKFFAGASVGAIESPTVSGAIASGMGSKGVEVPQDQQDIAYNAGRLAGNLAPLLAELVVTGGTLQLAKYAGLRSIPGIKQAIPALQKLAEAGPKRAALSAMITQGAKDAAATAIQGAAAKPSQYIFGTGREGRPALSNLPATGKAFTKGLGELATGVAGAGIGGALSRGVDLSQAAPVTKALTDIAGQSAVQYGIERLSGQPTELQNYLLPGAFGLMRLGERARGLLPGARRPGSEGPAGIPNEAQLNVYLADVGVPSSTLATLSPDQKLEAYLAYSGQTLEQLTGVATPEQPSPTASGFGAESLEIDPVTGARRVGGIDVFPAGTQISRDRGISREPAKTPATFKDIRNELINRFGYGSGQTIELPDGRAVAFDELSNDDLLSLYVDESANAPASGPLSERTETTGGRPIPDWLRPDRSYERARQRAQELLNPSPETPTLPGGLLGSNVPSAPARPRLPDISRLSQALPELPAPREFATEADLQLRQQLIDYISQFDIPNVAQRTASMSLADLQANAAALFEMQQRGNFGDLTGGQSEVDIALNDQLDRLRATREAAQTYKPFTLEDIATELGLTPEQLTSIGQPRLSQVLEQLAAERKLPGGILNQGTPGQVLGGRNFALQAPLPDVPPNRFGDQFLSSPLRENQALARVVNSMLDSGMSVVQVANDLGVSIEAVSGLSGQDIPSPLQPRRAQGPSPQEMQRVDAARRAAENEAAFQARFESQLERLRAERAANQPTPELPGGLMGSNVPAVPPLGRQPFEAVRPLPGMPDVRSLEGAASPLELPPIPVAPAPAPRMSRKEQLLAAERRKKQIAAKRARVSRNPEEALVRAGIKEPKGLTAAEIVANIPGVAPQGGLPVPTAEQMTPVAQPKPKGRRGKKSPSEGEAVTPAPTAEVAETVQPAELTQPATSGIQRGEVIQTTSGGGIPSRIEGVDVDDIKVDAEAYQFKSGGDEFGVTGRLREPQAWDSNAAGTVILHERNDGTLYVVNGHQRTGLARRLRQQGVDVPPLLTRIYREADGITVPMARRLGAMANLNEGSASLMDVAKVLREGPLTPAEKSTVSRSAVRTAEDLARLGDEAFSLTVNEIIPPEYAAAVGRYISTPAEQVAALKVLAKNPPTTATEADLMVQDIRNAGFRTVENMTLFGLTADSESLIKPRAQILEALQRQLTSERSAFGNAIRNEGRLTERGNVLAREENVKGYDAAKSVGQLLEIEFNKSGEFSSALSEAARRLSSGEINQQQATKIARDAIERVYNNLTGARTGSGEGRTTGPDGQAVRPSGSAEATPTAVEAEPAPAPEPAATPTPEPAAAPTPEPTSEPTTDITSSEHVLTANEFRKVLSVANKLTKAIEKLAEHRRNEKSLKNSSGPGVVYYKTLDRLKSELDNLENQLPQNLDFWTRFLNTVILQEGNQFTSGLSQQDEINWRKTVEGVPLTDWLISTLYDVIGSPNSPETLRKSVARAMRARQDFRKTSRKTGNTYGLRLVKDPSGQAYRIEDISVNPSRPSLVDTILYDKTANAWARTLDPSLKSASPEELFASMVEGRRKQAEMESAAAAPAKPEVAPEATPEVVGIAPETLQQRLDTLQPIDILRTNAATVEKETVRRISLIEPSVASIQDALDRTRAARAYLLKLLKTLTPDELSNELKKYKILSDMRLPEMLNAIKYHRKYVGINLEQKLGQIGHHQETSFFSQPDVDEKIAASRASETVIPDTSATPTRGKKQPKPKTIYEQVMADAARSAGLEATPSGLQSDIIETTQKSTKKGTSAPAEGLFEDTGGMQTGFNLGIPEASGKDVPVSSIDYGTNIEEDFRLLMEPDMGPTEVQGPKARPAAEIAGEPQMVLTQEEVAAPRAKYNIDNPPPEDSYSTTKRGVNKKGRETGGNIQTDDLDVARFWAEQESWIISDRGEDVTKRTNKNSGRVTPRYFVGPNRIPGLSTVPREEVAPARPAPTPAAPADTGAGAPPPPPPPPTDGRPSGPEEPEGGRPPDWVGEYRKASNIKPLEPGTGRPLPPANAAQLLTDVVDEFLRTGFGKGTEAIAAQLRKKYPNLNLEGGFDTEKGRDKLMGALADAVGIQKDDKIKGWADYFQQGKTAPSFRAGLLRSLLERNGIDPRYAEYVDRIHINQGRREGAIKQIEAALREEFPNAGTMEEAARQLVTMQKIDNPILQAAIELIGQNSESLVALEMITPGVAARLRDRYIRLKEAEMSDPDRSFLEKFVKPAVRTIRLRGSKTAKYRGRDMWFTTRDEINRRNDSWKIVEQDDTDPNKIKYVLENSKGEQERVTDSELDDWNLSDDNREGNLWNILERKSDGRLHAVRDMSSREFERSNISKDPVKLISDTLKYQGRMEQQGQLLKMVADNPEFANRATYLVRFSKLRNVPARENMGLREVMRDENGDVTGLRMVDGTGKEVLMSPSDFNDQHLGDILAVEDEINAGNIRKGEETSYFGRPVEFEGETWITNDIELLETGNEWTITNPRTGDTQRVKQKEGQLSSVSSDKEVMINKLTDDLTLVRGLRGKGGVLRWGRAFLSLGTPLPIHSLTARTHAMHTHAAHCTTHTLLFFHPGSAWQSWTACKSSCTRRRTGSRCWSPRQSPCWTCAGSRRLGIKGRQQPRHWGCWGA
jgi:hypothetical protein